MEHLTHATVATRPPSSVNDEQAPLPDDRADWEEEAQHAYRWVLYQLDLWCRERNRPRQGNPWLAEQAVRRAW